MFKTGERVLQLFCSLQLSFSNSLTHFSLNIEPFFFIFREIVHHGAVYKKSLPNISHLSPLDDLNRVRIFAIIRIIEQRLVFIALFLKISGLSR